MGTAEYQKFVERNPVIRLFGYEHGAHSETHAELHLPIREDFLQVEGRVHGGILATLADTTAVYLLYLKVPDGWSMTSIEFKMNFLRPATLGAGELLSRATLVKLGRSVALCDVEVSQAGSLVAKGLFTYLMLDKGRAGSGS